MIEHVRTVGFKGFDLDEDVPQKVIYSGKNKSGKSTRAGAIAIALYGHIPFSTAGKRPGDILDSFGKDSLIAAVTIGGKEFARKFSRNEKGGVSQGVQINKKRVSSENFAIMLNKAGDPRIADVAEFMKQSEAKKIDTLFDLFPNDALASIDSDIEDAKADVSRLEKKKTGAESTVVRLTNSKQAIEIPAGSISATKAEIKGIEDQISDLEKQIKKAEIEETRVKAEKEGEQKGKELAEKEAAEKPLKTDEEWAQHDLSGPSSDPQMIEVDNSITRMENSINPNQKHFIGVDPAEEIGDDIFTSPRNRMQFSDSIQRIIDALTGAGCGTCAAMIVAKQELKKYV